MIAVDITPSERDIVFDILKKNLAPGTHVWVFGSRAQHNAKRFSDLDLAIDAGQPLPYAILVNLNHDFDESALPFKVDIVDWYAIDPSFKNRISIFNKAENAWDY